MADPLSIAALVIAVVGAAITVSDTFLSFIGQITKAPNEVMYVHNDVTDMRLVLSHVEANAAGDRSLDQRLAAQDDGILGNPQPIVEVEVLLKRTEQTFRTSIFFFGCH